ncbi:PQQ-binding-like beta-propeller repeat protein [Actinophytocola sp.]|uniref:outer membrane protein assembly factor BamB family protein n=1 Tax=Actinophytocola sp. TaxID=1872138 RepID=UPI003D6BBECC
MLVVAVAVLASLVVVHIGPLDVTTAATVRPAAVPTDPHRQAWAWEAPEGQRVNEVVTAGAGVAVRVVDGVIAIDGTTGKERWHYRRTGSRTSGLGVSPDGRFLLVSFYSSVEDVEGVRVISLDAMTGEEAGFDEVTEGGVFRGIRMEMTNRVLLGGNPDEGLFRGYDLRSGERLWEYRKPQTCRFGDVAGKPMVGRDVVLFGLVCGPKEPRSENVTVTVTLLALDDRTGAERWSIERQVPALAQKGSGPDGDFWTSPGWNIDQFLELASDGSAVSFGWTDSETGAEDRFLADAATGDVLLDATALPTGEIVEFTKEWLVTGKGSVSDAYTITTIVTGSSRAVGEISVRGPSERWFTGELVVGFGQWFSTENACRNMVSIAPWDGAPPRRANIHFGRHDADQYCEYPELELAPGAIVAWHSDTNRIVGIA